LKLVTSHSEILTKINTAKRKTGQDPNNETNEKPNPIKKPVVRACMCDGHVGCCVWIRKTAPKPYKCV
jgi:hypothetical protein